MTEAEARAALRAFVAVSEIERWIAKQRWEAVPGGWRARERYRGWRFQVKSARGGEVAGGLNVVEPPAAWFVPGRQALQHRYVRMHT